MNPAIDLSAGTNLITADRKLRFSHLRHEPGGGGVNVSRAIRKMGGESTAVCMTRNQKETMLLELLQAESISTLPVHINDPTRENFHIYEESTGKQYRFDMPGPTVNKEEWQSCLYILEKMNPVPDYMVVSGSLPKGVPSDFYARIARRMQKADVRIILDSSGESLEAAVAEGVFLIKPNLRELQLLNGSPIKSEEELEHAAMDIAGSKGCESVIVSLGAAGALAVTGNEYIRVIAPWVPCTQHNRSG